VVLSAGLVPTLGSTYPESQRIAGCWHHQKFPAMPKFTGFFGVQGSPVADFRSATGEPARLSLQVKPKRKVWRSSASAPVRARAPVISTHGTRPTLRSRESGVYPVSERNGAGRYLRSPKLI
jgi:hypothetical protein